MALIIFDLDGTLIDSAPDIHASVNRMLADQQAPALDLATVTSFIGNGLPKLVERVIRATGMDIARHAELTQIVHADYTAHPADLTEPYPGAIEALSKLRAAGHRLGLCTNKPEVPAREVLAHFGLTADFPVVVGGDTLPTRKPNPDMLFKVRDDLGGGPVVYVGDSEVDAETAQNAGVPFALFTRGYRKTPVDQIPHKASFDDFADLPDLISRMI